MWLLYIIALVPLFIGFLLWFLSKRITLWEWLIGLIVPFVFAGIIHGIAVSSMTADVETWSGKITKFTHTPRWVERYEVAIYRTVTRGSGKNKYTTQEFSHYETRYRTHYPSWTAYTDFGKETHSFGTSEGVYKEFKIKFGEEYYTRGYRPGFYSGDRRDYHLKNVKNYVQPTTINKSFENRIKAAPTTFSFIKVPEDFKGLYEYPENRNKFRSDRLVGKARTDFNYLEFDRMCSRLGSKKKVNIVLIGFDPKIPASIAKYQEAKFIGGKKNDLIICYSKNILGSAQWAYVFGWTEKEIVKRKLEQLFLDEKINTKLLTKIEEYVNKYYVIKDWSKFDYISVEPPSWSWITLVILVFVFSIGYYIWAFLNEHDGHGLI
jgi:hypothetical protein